MTVARDSLSNSTDKEEDAVLLAMAELKSVKEAAQAGLIDEKEVLKLVIENIAEISGD